jgi:hypothetical protein
MTGDFLRCGWEEEKTVFVPDALESRGALALVI